jgi:ABC-type multidrug transport system fused ATPase/permease subunit
MADIVVPEQPPSEDSATSENTQKPAEAAAQGGFKDYWRIFTFTDRYDRILNGVALITSIAAGATLPLMTIIFGHSITQFNDFAAGSASADSFKNEVNHLVLLFIYLFVARFALSYITTVAITITATRTVRAFRQAFLSHTIRQEIWHFDKQSNGATATQVGTAIHGLTVNANLGLRSPRMGIESIRALQRSSLLLSSRCQCFVRTPRDTSSCVFFILCTTLISPDAYLSWTSSNHGHGSAIIFSLFMRMYVFN